MSTLTFTAIGRDQGASRMLQNIGRHADTAGRKMQTVNISSKIASGGMGMAAKGAAAVGTGLLAAAGAAVGYGLKIAAGNEQARIGFTTMLGSGKKAEAFLKDLEAFAAKTPFEFPELQKAASGLVAVGVKTKEIIPIMRTVGNVTSGMGTGSEGVQRAVLALQQMSAAGRISAEDLNQLRDAGLSTNIVFDAISQKTGISTKKLYEMRDAGKLGKRELDALMSSLASGKGFEKFNGLMDKQSKSLSGMLSTLKDTFGMGMAKALEPALPFIKGAIGAITKAVGDMFSWLQTHQEDFVQGIIDTGSAVFGLAKPFLHLQAVALTSLADIADSIARVLEGMEHLALGDQFSGAVKNLRDFSAGARGAGDAINNNLIPKIEKAHLKWLEFGRDQRTKAALRDANAEIVRALQRTDDKLKDNGRTLDQHTEKGRSNRAALRNLAETHVSYRDKLARTGAKTKDVDKYTEEARQTFIKTATKLGATRTQAEKLADKYGLLDRKINALNSKTIKLTAQYRGTVSKVLAKFVESIPAGNNRSGAYLAQMPIGGPARRSLDSVVGAPASAPSGMASGGPSLTNIKHSTPGLTNALGEPKHFNDATYSAARSVNKMGIRHVGKLGTDWLNEQLAAASAGAPGGSVGAYSAGMAGTIARLRAAGARSFTTYPGHHPSMAKARDVTPHNWKIANTARASKGVWYVIYRMRIASKNHGNTWRQYHPNNRRGDWQHVRHVHVAWYDKGGMLKPGWTMAYNGTGKNERVVPGGGGGAATVVNQYFSLPNYLGSKQELVAALVELKRQNRLDVVLR